jgi:hypothetical protein
MLGVREERKQGCESESRTGEAHGTGVDSSSVQTGGCGMMKTENVGSNRSGSILETAGSCVLRIGRDCHDVDSVWRAPVSRGMSLEFRNLVHRVACR